MQLEGLVLRNRLGMERLVKRPPMPTPFIAVLHEDQHPFDSNPVIVYEMEDI